MVIESLLQTSHEGGTILSVGVVLAMLVVLLLKLVAFVKTYRLFHNMPGSQNRHFFYGHLHQLPNNGEGRLAVGRKRMDENNGKYAAMWLGPFKVLVVVFHPETVKQIMRSTAPKSRSMDSPYHHALPWIGEGLIVANGHRWARSRRLLTPAFHFDILKDYMHIYNEAATRLFRKLDVFARTGESFDICPLMTLCTLEVILRCSLGFDGDIQGQGHPYTRKARELTDMWSHRTRHPIYWPDFIYRMTARGKKFLNHCDYVHQLAEEIIDKRKKELETGEWPKRKRLDFIDILLSARDENEQPMSIKEMRNEVDTFMFAGHDTTAAGIQWSLYNLAKHTDYQEKVQEEVDTVLAGREDQAILWQDLSKLETLSLCTKESMRLYPPVPFIQRELDTDLDFDGQRIPAGTSVAIAIVHLHRNKLVWDEPDEFRPERFHPKNKSTIDNFAYIPFAAGSRNCIGQSFAFNEEKVLLSRILHRYNVTVAPDAKPPQRLASAILKSENGIWLKVQRRSHD